MPLLTSSAVPSNRFRTGWVLAGLMWAASFAWVPAAGAVDAPEGTVKGQHGDWQIVCKDPPPGSKSGVCALVQSVTAVDRYNIGLTVYFQ